MLSFKDFEKDGKIDWEAYRKAKVDNGDDCMTCGHFLLFGGKGYKQECNDCQNLHKPGASHEKLLRCPSCGKKTFPDWEHGIHKEGEHPMTCEGCDADYIVETQVSYTFTCRSLDEKEDI